MDYKTRRIIIIGSILTFIVIPVAVTFIVTQINKQPVTTDQTETADVVTLPDRSNDDLITTITSNTPNLVIDGKPSFTVVDVKKPQRGWYIVTIRTNDDIDGLNPAKVLIQDTGASLSPLRVISGPGTAFPQDEMRAAGVPDAVTQELNT